MSDSNPAPNESFDALIDLLASDDVVEDPRFQNTGRPPGNENLRDPDGRMNLSKIHSFFAGNNQGEPNDSNPSQANPLDDAKNTRSPSPNRDKSPHSAASSPLPGTPYLSRSTATTPAENLLDGDDSFHGPTELSTIGSWRDHSSLTSQSQIDHQPTLLEDVQYRDGKPLEVEALTQALSLANAEVKALRDQCDDLRSTVQRTRSGNPPKNFSKMTPPMPAPTSSRKQSENFPEIAYMNEDEAKKTLASLLSSLSLPTSDALSKTSNSLTIVPSIQRALDFVIRTDQLIWRRAGSCGPRAPKAAVFDDENINALTERLELWERIIRTPRS